MLIQGKTTIWLEITTIAPKIVPISLHMIGIFKSKLVFFIILALIGVTLAFIRFSRNKGSNGKLKKILKRIDADPEYAKKIATDLTCFIGRNPLVGSDKIRLLINHLKPQTRLGKYTIHEVLKLNRIDYLIITLCEDNDFGLTSTGQMDTIKEVYQINFILRSNHEKEQEEIRSHQYRNREEERLLKEFSKTLFEELNKL